MKNYYGEKVLVRGIQSGVYFGTLVERNGQDVEMCDVRNIQRWNGANTLLDLAENGARNTSDCRFSNKVDSLVLTDVCEIVPCSEKAIKAIEGVSEWTY